jgi:hypothetical protein
MTPPHPTPPTSAPPRRPPPFGCTARGRGVRPAASTRASRLLPCRYLNKGANLMQIDAEDTLACLRRVSLPFERLVRNVWTEGPEVAYDRYKAGLQARAAPISPQSRPRSSPELSPRRSRRDLPLPL